MATKATTRLATKADKKASSGGPGSLGKSHKSFQPVTPCGNKLLQQKWDKTYYDEHRRLVKTAKPMVDTKAPKVRPHVTSKWKKQQIEKERAQEIDRDNYTLLKKMQRIMQTEGGVDHKNGYKHHSLNQSQRQREMERVAKENAAMLKRLEKVEPIYKVSDWVDDWRRKQDLTERITAYPNEYQASRPVSRSRSTKGPPTPTPTKQRTDHESTEVVSNDSEVDTKESPTGSVAQDSEQPDEEK